MSLIAPRNLNTLCEGKGAEMEGLFSTAGVAKPSAMQLECYVHGYP